ncbi:MAG: hypothetical protein DRP74_06915 [Candidatus Omnitrophota bacterium]|nr:MAG: hypothetical protein DRP74_06915 [Candidatus Omnitrophota bacterium]
MRIDTRLSERLKKVNPSSTLAITAKTKKLKAEGKDIVNFSAGEPDFDTPDFAKNAAVSAINQGFTKYTPASGTPELKKKVAEKFQKENSLNYPPEQIIVSCGAKHSLFNALFILINPGDEILIPSPYWVSYPEMVNLCGGKTQFIKTLAENKFKIKPKDLKSYITNKTKALIINSPSNPSGCVYTRKELEEIADICLEKKIFVISDEIYEKLIYDNLEHISIGSLKKELANLVITVNGVSKSFSMTGWRIGYLAGPIDVVEAIAKFQSHSTSNPTSISQKAALAALDAPEDFYKQINKTFHERRDFALERLTDIPKINFVKPQGAFYIFCDISATGMNSLNFSQRLLDEALVSVIPGEGFGANDYIRLSFATSMEQLQKGLERIENWIKQV